MKKFLVILFGVLLLPVFLVLGFILGVCRMYRIYFEIAFENLD